MALIPPLSIALAFALFGVACCFAISMAIAGRGLRLSWSVVSLPLAFAWLVLGHWLESAVSGGRSVQEGSLAASIQFWFWIALPILLCAGARLYRVRHERRA
jgi:hypothetical protein